MSDSIQLYFDNDGKAKIYDDTYDIAIHCETEEEYDKAMQMLKRAKEMQWIPCSERLPEEDKEVLVTVYFHGLKQTHPTGWNDHINPSYYVIIYHTST